MTYKKEKANKIARFVSQMSRLTRVENIEAHND